MAAVMPTAKVPRMPAIAPCEAKALPSGAKMVTPKAIAEGSATSMAASPPQKSPDIPAGDFGKVVFGVVVAALGGGAISATPCVLPMDGADFSAVYAGRREKKLV